MDPDCVVSVFRRSLSHTVPAVGLAEGSAEKTGASRSYNRPGTVLEVGKPVVLRSAEHRI